MDHSVLSCGYSAYYDLRYSAGWQAYDDVEDDAGEVCYHDSQWERDGQAHAEMWEQSGMLSWTAMRMVLLMVRTWLAIRFWTAAVILAGTAATCLNMVVRLGKLPAVLVPITTPVPGIMQASLMLMLMTTSAACTAMSNWVRTTKVFLGCMVMCMIRHVSPLLRTVL